MGNKGDPIPSFIDRIDQKRLIYKSPFVAVTDSHMVYWYNGTKLGEVVKLEDGYFYYFALGQGGWGAGELQQLGEMLNTLNKNWDEEVRKGLEDANRKD
jgi:hypothetical protein